MASNWRRPLAGNRLNVRSTPASVIEPAPDIGVIVRFNGQQLPAVLSLGEAETLQFGNFTVEIEPVEIIPKLPVTNDRGPIKYQYTFKSAAGIHKYLGVDEAEAIATFKRRLGPGEEFEIIDKKTV